MNYAYRGDAALQESNYKAAIELFTLALQSEPNAATYYVKRSQAYVRSSNYTEALVDAEVALSLAVKRGKRELIAQAQLRRGIALFQLGQYANARHVFRLVKEYDDRENATSIWLVKLDAKLKDADEETTKVTVEDFPKREIPTPIKKETNNPVPSVEIKRAPEQEEQHAAPAVPPPAAKEKIRHDWYQTNTDVTVSLLVKGVPKDQATVDIQPTSISVSFPTSSGAVYDFSLMPLFDMIDPGKSTYKVLSTKIEIQLKKAIPHLKWHQLESQGTTETDAVITTQPRQDDASAARPKKDWDKVMANMTRTREEKEASGETPEKTKDDDNIYLDDDDDDGGDPANAFFKKLYAGADPDTRRAMMKSYQESGGTTLSTNWAQVKDKRVEISPPDGMEAKKWGE